METDLDVKFLADHDVHVLAIFRIIADFSRRYHKHCEPILAHIAKNIEQNHNRIFSLFFLFWILYVKSGRISQSEHSERIKKIIRGLQPTEQRAIFKKGVILNSLWNDATSAEIHEWLDETFLGVSSQQSEYCQLLYRSGSGKWSKGDKAEVQANAFMEYILNAPQPIFDRWTAKPLKIGGYPEIVGCFIGIGTNPAALSYKDKEVYGSNIYNTLEEFVLDRKFTNRIAELRKRLQLSKRTWMEWCVDWWEWFEDECRSLLFKFLSCIERFWKFILIVIGIALIVLLISWQFGVFSAKTDSEQDQNQNATHATIEPDIPPPVIDNPPQDETSP